MLCWQVALTAFYQTPGGSDAFATTFFNQTIDIVETKKLVDVELISLYATIAALLAGLGALAPWSAVTVPRFASHSTDVKRMRVITIQSADAEMFAKVQPHTASIISEAKPAGTGHSCPAAGFDVQQAIEAEPLQSSVQAHAEEQEMLVARRCGRPGDTCTALAGA